MRDLQDWLEVDDEHRWLRVYRDAGVWCVTAHDAHHDDGAPLVRSSSAILSMALAIVGEQLLGGRHG